MFSILRVTDLPTGRADITVTAITRTTRQSVKERLLLLLPAANSWPAASI